jgi:transposase InsO family protein
MRGRRGRPSRCGGSRTALRHQLRVAHRASRGVYGSPRLHQVLRQAGHRISRKRVIRLMRVDGLCGRAWRRRFPVTTASDPYAQPATNQLGRQFTVTAHSDRGAQYTSDRCQALLRRHGFRCSMSRPGNCYDNAPAESLFRTLKTELAPQTHATRRVATTVIPEYIERFYNRERQCSNRRGLGYPLLHAHTRFLHLSLRVGSCLRAAVR